MATATTSTGNLPTTSTSASSLRPYRMTVEVYERIAASGALGDKSGVFLWKGQLVEKVSDMTRGRPHVFALNRLDRILSGFIPEGYFVEQEQPLDLGETSAPEPDLKVVRGRDLDYLERVPTAGNVPLVAEVADASLADDTGEMLRAYAGALMAEYWVVNIPGRRVEVYTGPGRRAPDGSPGYASCRQYGPDDEVPVVLDGREVGRIPVREVLP